MSNSQNFNYMGYLDYINTSHNLISRCNENTNNKFDECFNNLSILTNIGEILFVIIILIIFLRFITYKIKLNIVEVYLIFIYHTAFSFLFIFYTISRFRVDPISNYLWSLTNPTDYLPGKDFLEYIVHIFSYHLSLSYFSVSLIFGYFGLIGILLLYKMIKEINKNVYLYYLGLIFILLPSFHFWHSGIGKDSIILMVLSLVLYWMIFQKKLNLNILFSLILIFMIRPHIAFLLMPFIFLILFSSDKVNSNIKIIVSIIGVFIIYYLTPIILLYVGIYIESLIDIFSYEFIAKIIEVIEHRETLNYSETAGYNLQSLNLIEKIFYFLFRPLPFDARSNFQLIISFENIGLIILFITSIFLVLKSKQINLNIISLTLLFYIILFLIVLSINTGNFGISSRQKWMILPYIFILILFLNNKKLGKKL